MQGLQAGQHKLIYLELQTEMVASLARQAGFEAKAKDGARAIQLDLTAPARQAPLLLFDAADPAYGAGFLSPAGDVSPGIDGERCGGVRDWRDSASGRPNREHRTEKLSSQH